MVFVEMLQPGELNEQIRYVEAFFDWCPEPITTAAISQIDHHASTPFA
jgi:hypothetical protein